MIGTSANDELFGGDADDVLDGLQGDDVLLGGGGDDVFLLRAGEHGAEEVIDGGDGWNVIRIAAGAEVQLSTHVSNIQRIVLESGGSVDASALSTGLTILGSAGADQIAGGAGDDALDGDAGDDVYRFGRGCGADRVFDYGAGNDGVYFGGGLSSGDIDLARSGDDLVLTIRGTADQIILSRWFDLDILFKVENFWFSEGASWDARAVQDMFAIAGTDGGDMLRGTDGRNILDGGAGDDFLYGGRGDDGYVFARGYGVDYVSDYDAAGNRDRVEIVGDEQVLVSRMGSHLVLSLAGTGDKLILGDWFADAGYRIEEIRVGPNAVWDAEVIDAMLALPGGGTPGDDALVGTRDNDALGAFEGNDTLKALDGDDTLDGGAGEDFLYGGRGNDTYKFDRGYGADYISDWDPNPDNVDAIELGVEIATTDMSLARAGSHLSLSLDGTTDELILGDWFGEAGYRIEQVRFFDGTVWDAAAINAMLDAPAAGTAGGDTLRGTDGSDSLDGLAGNDFLYGGRGNDTYKFDRGYGVDYVSDYDATAGNADTVELGAGIAATDVAIERKGGHLYLGLQGSGDKLILGDWFVEAGYKVEQVRFADGTTWSEATISALLAARIGPSSGSDTLDGTAGSDTLDGGAGNDFLYGGRGDDTYKFDRGYGVDYVSDWDPTQGNVDTVEFAAGIGLSELTFSKAGSHLVLALNGTTDKLYLGDWYADAGYRVEQLRFADGTTSSVETQAQALIAAMAAFAPPAGESASLGGTDPQGTLLAAGSLTTN